MFFHFQFKTDSCPISYQLFQEIRFPILLSVFYFPYPGGVFDHCYTGMCAESISLLESTCLFCDSIAWSIGSQFLQEDHLFVFILTLLRWVVVLDMLSMEYFVFRTHLPTCRWRWHFAQHWNISECFAPRARKRSYLPVLFHRRIKQEIIFVDEIAQRFVWYVKVHASWRLEVIMCCTIFHILQLIQCCSYLTLAFWSYCVKRLLDKLWFFVESKPLCEFAYCIFLLLWCWLSVSIQEGSFISFSLMWCGLGSSMLACRSSAVSGWVSG